MKRFLFRAGLLLWCLLFAGSLTSCVFVIKVPETLDVRGLDTLLEGMDPIFEDSTVCVSDLLFWKIEDPDGEGVLYLLGSIHAAPDNLYPLPDEVGNAFREADALAVECDTDALSKSEQAELYRTYAEYADGTSAMDHMGADLFARASDAVTKCGYSAEVLSDYRTMVWADILEEDLAKDSKYSYENGVDQHFLDLAREEGKRIVELETVAGQLSLWYGAPDLYANLYLSEMLEETAEEYEANLDRLYALWKGGDEDAFAEYTLAEGDLTGYSEEEVAAVREMNRNMVDERNARMSARAEELIETGETTFFVVGAAHTVGDTGIVRALIDAGYEVAPA